MTAMHDPLTRWQKPQVPRGSLWERVNGTIRALNHLAERRSGDVRVANRNTEVVGARLAALEARLPDLDSLEWKATLIREDLNHVADRLERRVDLITRSLVDAGLLDASVLEAPLWEGCPNDCPPDEACDWCNEHPWHGCYVCARAEVTE